MVKQIPVRVAVRCRPLSSQERSQGRLQVVKRNDSQIIVGERSFTFDFAFGPESSQEEVYKAVVHPQIDNLFEGYNVTVLAYGQTGSGKTYTMGTAWTSVSDGEPGVIPRAVDSIFTSIKDKPDQDISVHLSFLEIYNEVVLDLFNDDNQRESLKIRDSTGDVYVENLREVRVYNVEDVMDLLQKGSKNRQTASTLMNRESSRSHAIFTLKIEQKPKGASSKEGTTAKFHLVDLAGSERCKKTAASGSTFREGVKINLSLLKLGVVINALCEGNFASYRDSKLTRLLRDSLGGNSHTTMIACISGADYNADETLNTLRYADRARQIKNIPVVNRDPQAEENIRLRKLVEMLQKKLKEAGVVIENGMDECDTAEPPAPTPFEESQQIRELKDLLAEREDELANERMKTEKLSAALAFAQECHMKLMDERNALQIEIKQAKDIVESNSDDYIDMEEETTKKMEDDNDKIMAAASLEPELGSVAAIQETPSDAIGYFDMQRKLHELDENISVTEGLVKSIVEARDQVPVTMADCTALADKVEQLEKEKMELTEKLKSFVTSKLSKRAKEQVTTRLPVLEKEIQRLKKDLRQKELLLKNKADQDKKLADARRQMNELKRLRVKLQKDLSNERAESMKRIKSMEQQVNRAHFDKMRVRSELSQKQRLFEQQQRVLKQKMLDCQLANKKLQEALKRKVDVANKRNAKSLTAIDIQALVVAEWDYIKEREELILRREELANLQAEAKQEVDAFEKLCSETTDDAERLQNRRLLRQRNAEIRQLSAQLLEITEQLDKLQENESDIRSRIDDINTISEAKMALQSLLTWTCTHQSEYVHQTQMLARVREEKRALLEKLAEAERMSRGVAEERDRIVKQMQQQHEKRMADIFNEWRRTSRSMDNSDLPCNCSRLGWIQQQFNQKQRELAELEERIDRSRSGLDSYSGFSLEPICTPRRQPRITGQNLPRPTRVIRSHEEINMAGRGDEIDPVTQLAIDNDHCISLGLHRRTQTIYRAGDENIKPSTSRIKAEENDDFDPARDMVPATPESLDQSKRKIFIERPHQIKPVLKRTLSQETKALTNRNSKLARNEDTDEKETGNEDS